MFDESKCIVPIFHAATPNRPDVFGTGTLIRIQTESFLLTAAHVLDEKLKGELYVPLGKCLSELHGRYLCSARRKSPDRADDLSDTCVIRLQADLASELEKQFQFVPYNLLDPNETLSERAEYEFTGFPTTRDSANISAGRIRAKPYVFTGRSLLPKKITEMGYNPTVHIAVHFKRQKNRNEKGLRVTNPKPEGVSGGGVWRVWRRAGIFGDTHTKRLVGIAMAHNQRHEALVGVRLHLAFDAIRRMCPDLANLLPRPRFIQFASELGIEVPAGGYCLGMETAR